MNNAARVLGMLFALVKSKSMTHDSLVQGDYDYSLRHLVWDQLQRFFVSCP